MAWEIKESACSDPPDFVDRSAILITENNFEHLELSFKCWINLRYLSIFSYLTLLQWIQDRNLYDDWDRNWVNFNVLVSPITSTSWSWKTSVLMYHQVALISKTNLIQLRHIQLYAGWRRKTKIAISKKSWKRQTLQRDFAIVPPLS